MEKGIPTAGVLILKYGKVLLVKHTSAAGHLTATFGIPAGRLRQNETEIEGAIRELKEESGLITSKKSLFPLPKTYKAVIERKGRIKYFSLKVFVCDAYHGDIKKSKETIPRWISLNKLKEINLLPNQRQIIRDGVKFVEVPKIVY